MRKMILAVALAIGLSGCANTLQKLETAAGVVASPTTVYVARNSFDALEASATNYIKYCTPKKTAPGCSSAAIAQLIPAVRAGRVARNNLTAYAAANPGAGTPTSLYNALVTATNTLQAVASQYNIGGVK